MAKIYGDIVCFDGFSKHLFIKRRKLKSLAGLPYNVTPRYRKITGLPMKRPLVSLIGKLVHLYIAQSSRYVK